MGRINAGTGVRKDIDIGSSFTEKFLVVIKEFVLANRKAVLYGLIGLLAVIILAMSGVVYLDRVNEDNLVKFEKIMSSYMEQSARGNLDEKKRAVSELKAFADSTSFGDAHRLSLYALGNIYYAEKMYGEAGIYLVKFADNASSSVFAPMSLLKAAISAEQRGDLKSAMSIYNRLEEDYSDSFIADQIYYNMGRLYAIKKDVFNAKKYYHKVIAAYPGSLYMEKAKRRLFLLGAEK